MLGTSHYNRLFSTRELPCGSAEGTESPRDSAGPYPVKHLEGQVIWEHEM